MIPYWLLLFIPLWNCLLQPRSRWQTWQCFLIWIILAIFIGLRHEIGGDWFSYLPYLDRAQGLQISQILAFEDPSYNLINWIFSPFTWGIYGVNLVCSSVFSLGLVLFCRAQPRPWLALCLAIPYLVIVVSMGYSRQAVAIGLIMPALLLLEVGKLRLFLILVLLASSFHSTALIMLALVVPAVPGRTLFARALRFFIVLIVALTIGHTFFLSRLDFLFAGYIEAQMESEGAAIRVAMNVMPAVILLAFTDHFALKRSQTFLWGSISLFSILCALLLFFVPSISTAIDRLALYAIPLQMFVGSRLPGTHLFSISPIHLTLTVLVFCVAVQFVWLNFAAHSSNWLPYSNFLAL